MHHATLSADTLQRVAKHASLCTVNALLRSCHELSRIRVEPPCTPRVVDYAGFKVGLHTLSNGVRDGLTVYTRAVCTLTITYHRGQITRWSIISATATAMYGSLMTMPAELLGIANTRAWLSLPHSMCERHIMRWLMKNASTIDADPITGLVSVSHKGKPGQARDPGQCVYVASTHRVHDERARVDIVGLTAWMTDIAARVEPSIDCDGTPTTSFEYFTALMSLPHDEFTRRG